MNVANYLTFAFVLAFVFAVVVVCVGGIVLSIIGLSEIASLRTTATSAADILQAASVRAGAPIAAGTVPVSPPVRLSESNLIAPASPCQFALTAGSQPLDADTCAALIDVLRGRWMGSSGQSRLAVVDHHGNCFLIDLATTAGYPNTVTWGSNLLPDILPANVRCA